MAQITKSSYFTLFKSILFLLFLSVTSVAFSASKADLPNPKKNQNKQLHKQHTFPEWFVDSPFLDLEEVSSDAASAGKQGVMILYTTQGCSYCEQFIRISLHDPNIASLVQQDFASIGLEIFDDTEMVSPTGDTMSVKRFAKQQGVGFAPTLLFFDNTGKRVLRQVGYQAPSRFKHLLSYVANKYYQTQNLRDFIDSKQGVNPAGTTYAKLQQDTLFDKPPYGLDRSHFNAQEPLMVLFEKIACIECQTFHQDVMKLQEVRTTLKQFQVIRMDVDDDKTPVLLPSGEKTTPAKWYKSTAFSRLPALMFFDEKGKKALETDALVQSSRMMNSLNYMLEKAYQKDWSYQQFARSKSIEKNLQQAKP